MNNVKEIINSYKTITENLDDTHKRQIRQDFEKWFNKNNKGGILSISSDTSSLDEMKLEIRTTYDNYFNEIENMYKELDISKYIDTSKLIEDLNIFANEEDNIISLDTDGVYDDGIITINWKTETVSY